MEGGADGAGEVYLPGLRDHHPTAGALPSDRPRPGGPEPAGNDPGSEVRAALAAESAKRFLRREGIDLDVSTLADWVGACTAALAPLEALIRAHVMAAERIHGDDTTVPVLAKGKTITGRLWTYVRDDWPFGGPAPPAAVFFYSRDRGGEYPNRHLAAYAGILQADAYAGFNDLYAAGRQPGPITEAACWAHGRRKFFDLASLGRAPLAVEAIRRIDVIFNIERSIKGLTAEQRLAVRRKHVTPQVMALETWMRAARGKMSRHADVAKAIDYMLKRWEAFSRFLRDGRICLTNNAAERALRGIATPELLCTSSSSIWKHWELVFGGDDDTGALCARSPSPRLARQGPWRGFGTARRERPAQRAERPL